MLRRAMLLSSAACCLIITVSCSNPVSNEPSGNNPQRQEEVGEGEDVRAPNGTNLGAEPINAGTSP